MAKRQTHTGGDTEMVNILLEGYGIGASWIHRALKKYIRAGCKVAVVAFSFRGDRVRDADGWRELYSRERGTVYRGIVGGLASYGIREEDISFINCFEDSNSSAKEKIEHSDILYFPGGVPDKIMERLREFELLPTLAHYDGIVIGYSAGALVQLSEYHLTPDSDYPHFGYYEGLGYLSGFYLEVHYEGTDEQRASVARVLSERRERVYALSLMRGGIIVKDGEISTIGDVVCFDPQG